ncbi:MAG TPA: transglycosylase SLT domain-containing protein [Jatrophihabitans sp.]|nr:transglycosylase SLT domain-containing protein [Jatrophihabitans sp.]
MSIDAVLARMAAIQSQLVSLGLAPKPANAASGVGFASALNEANAASTVAVASSPLGTNGSAVTGSAVVASAEKYLGVPYVWGGTTSAGLDCSGLVQKAYGDLGISLPRLAADQAHAGTAVPSLDQAQPGDILAFGDPAYHVAIYLGDNKMIAAPEPGEKVKIQDVYQTPTSIRRVVGQSGNTFGWGTVSPLVPATAPSGVAQYGAIFAATSARYGLPPGLLAAVAQTESGGNASAVSPAGAQGLMQLMPSTASGLGVDPWDPTQAVQGAAQLLSGYLTRFGSVPLALAAYNAGPGAVEQYGGIPPYQETQNYVAKITGLMAGAAA